MYLKKMPGANAAIKAEAKELHRRTKEYLVDTLLPFWLERSPDPEYGGMYADIPMNGPTRQTEKQFWQQAEGMVGLLDAYSMFREEKYWLAFRNIYDFVFSKFVHYPGGGEWFERLDREGNPVDDALDHSWKICYHNVRSMIQTVKRLRKIASANIQ